MRIVPYADGYLLMLPADGLFKRWLCMWVDVLPIYISIEAVRAVPSLRTTCYCGFHPSVGAGASGQRNGQIYKRRRLIDYCSRLIPA